MKLLDSMLNVPIDIFQIPRTGQFFDSDFFQILETGWFFDFDFLTYTKPMVIPTLVKTSVVQFFPFERTSDPVLTA